MESLLYNEALNHVKELKEEKLRLSQNLDTIENTIQEMHSIVSSLKLKSKDADVFSPRNRESFNKEKIVESENRLNDLESQKKSLMASIENCDLKILRFTEMLELESERQEDELLVKKYISAYHHQTLSFYKKAELLNSNDDVSCESRYHEVSNILNVCNQVVFQDPMVVKGYLDKALSILDSCDNSKQNFSDSEVYKYAGCYDKQSFQKSVIELPSFQNKIVQSDINIEKHTALFYMIIYNFLYEVFDKLVSRSVAEKIQFSCIEKDKLLQVHLSYLDNLYPENYEFLYALDSITEFVHLLSGSENIKWNNNIILDIHFSLPVPNGLML